MQQVCRRKRLRFPSFPETFTAAKTLKARAAQGRVGVAFSAVLVGCGAMSRGWLEPLGLAGLKNRVNLVGLCDVDVHAAEKRRDEFGLDAAVGADLAALLEQTKPDLVFDVVVPAARHAVVSTALSHGCHVLSEKPMSPSIEEGRDLVARARVAGKVHAIMQNRRYNEGTRRIRAAIESGVIGDITAIHADFFVAPHFGGFREQMQDVLLIDMAIHTLDAARFMSGKAPLAVYCHQSNPKGSWYAHGAVANAIFEMSDGVIFTYRGSWAAEGQRTSWDSEWRVVGTQGMLTWDGLTGFRATVKVGEEGFLRPTAFADLPFAEPAETGGHGSVLNAFVDALEAGREPETAGSDNIKSLDMVFAAIESSRTGRRVEISQ
jgi:predicted dehydrogenase